jgi:serum/glucocorticoid-regulated kinase 2
MKSLLSAFDFNKNDDINKQLEPNETVKLSASIFKFNKKDKKQERNLVITNKHIFNLGKSQSVKRKIPIAKVAAITASKVSSEFVIHVPDEYDYRYSSADQRDHILEAITIEWCKIYTHKPGLPFFYKDDIELTNYTTLKADRKKGISKIPAEEPKYLNEDTYKTKETTGGKKRSNTLYSRDKKEVSVEDFNPLKVLGRGAFGKVMLVEKKDTKEIFAMKSLRKEELIDKDQVEHTKTEKRILETINHPFLVNLEYVFQTPEKVFFVMQFMRGGELFQHLKNDQIFPEPRSKFYVAIVAMALGHLHSKDIIYRDLKPENVLMDEKGFVYLTDFGMAKELPKGELAMSFCGTPEYLAPEIITGEGHGREADWWSLGILAYETLFGIPPFYSENQMVMYELIRECDLKFPSSPSATEEAKDFIRRLLVKDPKKRLGAAHDFDDMKKHPWFNDINWDKLAKKEIDTPFKPQVQGDKWLANFDEEFTQEEAINSYAAANLDLISKYQKDFDEFTAAKK